MDDSTNFGKASSSGPAPQIRVGDAERQGAADRLQAHFSAGRITWDELDERLGRAWTARTQGDLTPLFTDLPAERVAPPVPSKVDAGIDRLQAIGQRFPVRPEFLVLLLVLAVAVVASEGAVLVPLAFLFVLGARHRGHHHPYRRSHGGHHGMRG